MGTEKTNDLPLTQAEEVTELESQINQEVKKFNVADAFIASLKEKYSGVVVASLEDKENIGLMKEGLKLARDSRISVEKKRKSLKEGYLAIGRAIDGEAKRITEGLLETETPLKAQKEKIENWENEEKERKAAEEKKFVDDRVELLKEAGISFDGSFYSIGQSISVDISTIKSLSDTDFKFLVAKVGAEAEKIRVEKELEDKRKKEEAERIEKQKADMAAKEAELARKEKEMADRLAKLEADEKAAQKAKADALAAETRRIEQERKERLEKLVNGRSSELATIGFSFDYPNREFVFKNGAGKHIIPLSTLEMLTGEEWESAKKTFAATVAKLIADGEKILEEEKEKERQRIIKEEAEKAAAEKAKQEKEEQEKAEAKRKQDELRPDVEKVIDFLTTIKQIAVPKVQDKELEDYLAEFKLMIDETVNDLQSRLAN